MFFVFCLLQKQCLDILTISLQVNLYENNFIQWFYWKGRSIYKIYEIKTINFESDIIRVRNFHYRNVCYGMVIFSKTQIKLTLFWKVYIETLAKNLIL